MVAVMLLKIFSDASDSAPQFLKPLRSYNVPEEMDLLLESHVTGSPTPDASWYQDTQQVDRRPPKVPQATSIASETSPNSLVRVARTFTHYVLLFIS